MSGHSKWSSIKHQKGVTDAKRGQLFTKLTQEIMLAVRQGGASPETNHRLELAIQKAKSGSMPWDNIERAIQKGAGTAEGAALNEMTLEGYGPNGVAILVQALSDNRNRTIQEVRSTFTRHGGNLAGSGSVAWLFESKGYLTIDTKGLDADAVALEAIEAGAEDVQPDDGYIEVYTKAEDFDKVRTALINKKFNITSAEIPMLPKTSVELDEKSALQTAKLMEKLEDLDDVQHVYTNTDFSDDVIEKIKTAA